MSIFSNILSKIFPSNHPAVIASQTTTTTASPSGSAPAAEAAAVPAPMTEVDLEEVLGGMAAKNSQQLNWKTSIVDLMKLLDLDSSLSARKELATELHYTGDQGDSASMNVWLQKQVMSKLAANGGKVPSDLK